jgi:hypothetical protein
MITTLQSDVNPDLYCYDTGLTFAQDIADKILQRVESDENFFPRRNNYNQGTDYRELVKSIGATKTRELIRRQQQVARNFPGLSPIKFRQYYLTEEYRSMMIDAVPSWLMIGDNNPNFMLQVSDSGDMLPTHKGHKRKCSLFMLLESDQQETRWYRNTGEFEVIDPLRIPDLDLIEPIVAGVMQPRRWYLFNHEAWHSVHKSTKWTKRVNIGIDYYDITADQLLTILKTNAE